MVKLNDYMIAGSADTPIEVVRDLSILGLTVIRERLAANPNTPLEILEKLALDADPLVRSAVAENAMLSRKIAEQLFRDEHPDVRFSLAENLKTPQDLIGRLTEDENPYIANVASKTLDILYFESMLTEEKFEVETGETARLGELLVASLWLGEDITLGCVRQATSQHVPLGQVLLRTGLVAPTVLLLALKLQSQIRRGQVSLSDAIQQLKDHRLYSKSA
ncbi:MAG: hypothetical protein C5B53_01765 [Candidatus Melainabacteria bacterium]|nr:MAG: hypothetical protein C5B53_01765 [Candidatus Melainabacteria bacterium]